MVKLTPSELVARREALGLTQAEFGTELAVHPITVSRWERGERRIPEMLALALEALEGRQRRRRRRRRRTVNKMAGSQE